MTGKNISVLLTGGTGFVGSRLARALAAEGCTVTVLVRPGSNRRELAPVIGRVKIVQSDGSTGDLVKIVAEARPEIVYHLASRFIAEHRTGDVAELMDSNVRFGAQLLEAMAVNGVRRLANAGTSWQHFAATGYRPVCLYAATKQAFEAILDFYVDAHAFRVITLKLFDTYGPEDPRPKLFRLLESAWRSEQALDMSAGEQLLDLVYIDDAVRAFLIAGARLLSEESAAKEEYGVSSGEPIALKEVVSMYAEVAGADLKVRWGARPYRAREVMVPWNGGATLPGWSPRVSLKEGLGRITRPVMVGAV